MKKIKIAQIGAGHDHATAAITTLKKQSDIFELVGYAVVPEDKDNLVHFSYEGNKNFYKDVKKMTVDELLSYPGLDAVFIETEDSALTKYAKMAAERGLHIHMDKPGGVDQKEFDELIDIVKAKNLVFHTGYMYRYNPAVIQLKKDIQNGKLGRIYSVEAQMNCLHKADKREWLGNYPGGMLYFLGCHLVDLVFSICGMPEDVIPLSTSIGEDGVSSEDFGMAIFKYKNGVSFVKSTAVEYGGFERRQLVVCGTRGTVELKPLEWIVNQNQAFSPQTSHVREVYSDEWFAQGTCRDSEVYDRYDGMYRAFAAYVNGEKNNPFDYEYERNLHKLILKACGR